MTIVFKEILSGVAAILMGTIIHIDETPSIYGYPLPKSVGTLFIAAGVFWILYAQFNKKHLTANWKTSKKLEKVFICPECLKPEYARDNPKLICADCQTSLEELDGFYERHPELKEKT